LHYLIKFLSAFPIARKPVCYSREWCLEKRDHKKLNIVILRFDTTEAASSKKRVKMANDLLKKLNTTIQDMGECDPLICILLSIASGHSVTFTRKTISTN
jgi:hypothetical protein